MTSAPWTLGVGGFASNDAREVGDSIEASPALSCGSIRESEGAEGMLGRRKTCSGPMGAGLDDKMDWISDTRFACSRGRLPSVLVGELTESTGYGSINMNGLEGFSGKGGGMAMGDAIASGGMETAKGEKMPTESFLGSGLGLGSAYEEPAIECRLGGSSVESSS